MSSLIQQFPHLFPSLAKKEDDSQYGDKTLADEVPAESGLLKDIAAMGPDLCENVRTLIEEVINKETGKPYDDRTYLLERVAKLVSSLPSDSKNREELTNTLVKNLWSSLQHPPLSYLSDECKYRTADGSYNNVNNPMLGASNTPYAKTCRAAKALHGAKPDPGLLFDLLLKREDGKFDQNPSGISAVFFYHATLIIHDIFRTSFKDDGINENSSYLDLQTLYGNNQEAQNTIRTFKDGKLKPDAFADARLLHQPPGCVVYLIMYNRYHNWVTDNLAAINEAGRFTMPVEANYQGRPEAYQAALKKRDEDLFQTARLVTTGLYINIAVGDYIRAINNICHSKSDWTLDPRVEIKPGPKFKDGLERGVGNSVSCEFNLLYRFHAPISRKDTQWMVDFFDNDVFKDRPKGKEVYELSIPEWLGMFKEWADRQEKDPGKKVFAGLTRDPKTGCFDTGKLVDIFKSSIEDPAGAFGAHNIPKHLRVVEILGILQARRWGVASLNEFREFFGLKRYKTFEEINSDAATADLLRKLYEHPDMVELYPGLFIEDVKKRMDPGSAVTPPFTVGRAVLSDAVTLVRGDRFFTLDYTSATLTAWGMAEVASNKKTLGGQMFYKLIQRALPGYFKFDSVWCMQPMYLPSMTAEIAKENGTSGDFSVAPPAPPPHPTLLNTHAAIKAILNDNRNFKVYTEGVLPASLIFRDFCLSGDGPANYQNHQVITAGMADCPVGQGQKVFENWFAQKMRAIIDREKYTLGKNIYQVDVVKDIGQVVAVHFVAEMFNLPLRTTEEPDEALSEDDIYNYLCTFLKYTSLPLDSADAWNLRRDCKEQTVKLKSAIINRINKATRPIQGALNLLSGQFLHPAASGSLKEMGQKLTKKLLSKYSAEDTASSMVASAAGGIFLPHQFSITLDWFLKPENAEYWAIVKDLATKDTPDANDKLKRCVLEAQRLASALGFIRVCVPEKGDVAQIKSDQGAPVALQKGTPVICNTTAALRDPAVYPDPNAFKLDRPLEDYIVYGWGVHMCPGRDVAMIAMTTMIKEAAKLSNLRRAPGEQGQLKSIPGPLGSKLYLDKAWAKLSPFTSTMKVHWDVTKS